MQILVINSGSSSLKYQLLDVKQEKALAAGVVERIGLEDGVQNHKVAPDTDKEEKITLKNNIKDHKQAMQMMVEALTHKDYGVIQDAGEVDGVGHRVVHGGELFSAPTVIDEKVLQGIKQTANLAPLHNPPALVGITVAQSFFNHCRHVAVFDTAFHQTIPPHGYHYGIPYELYKEVGIRRYGFHGTSHKYVVKRTAQLLEKDVEDINLITVHLGNGSSITAIKKGKSIENSMGMTPLQGVIMGTRCGDLDPGLIRYIAEKKDMTIQEVEDLLTKESGLTGLCGKSDLRDIHEAVAKGDKRAKLAVDVLCHHICKYIGAYWAILGHIDAIVFTAGIGENDEIIRAGSLKPLEAFGITLNMEINDKRPGEWACISQEDSKVKVLVVRTNEELEIARQTKELL